MVNNFIPDDSFKYFTDLAGQADQSVVFCKTSITFL